MNITKYEQSGFVIKSSQGAVIAIDFGMGTPIDTTRQIAVDAHVITHSHPDHCNLENIKELGCLTFGPPDISATVQEAGCRFIPVVPDEAFGIADLSLTPLLVDHGPVSKSLWNLGYIVESHARRFFICGDMKRPRKLPSQLNAIAIPVGGNKVFTATEAYEYITSHNYADIIIPVHTDIAAEDDALSKFEELVGNGGGLRVLNTQDSIQI